MKEKSFLGILPLTHLKNDLPAGLVVFLVALPLCLGIALASGAPLFSGLITGMVGGIVVSLFSNSSLSVSGPAAGLTVIVLNAIVTLGSYPAFLLAVVLAGVLQILLGAIKAGTIGNYFPSSVIKGMLAAIGIILIIKQIPHAVGYDKDYEGNMVFDHLDKDHVFNQISEVINQASAGAIIISSISLFVLLIWETKAFSKVKIIPAPLVVVVLGVIINNLFGDDSALTISQKHLVQIPMASNVNDFIGLFTLPDFNQWANKDIYIIAVTLAIVASLETLLSVEAVDKLDPKKRNTSTNRELKAQGIGNIVAGMIGGLPMTAVIVRGSANVNSGAQTKFSAFSHGCFLFLAIILAPKFINQIPLASLAAILLTVGYKLTKVTLFKNMYKIGWDQFIPFIVTIVAIVFTDLLKGIAVGMAVGVFYILRANMRNSYFFHREEIHGKKEIVKIILAQEVSFLNKASILQTLDQLPENSTVIIDGSQSEFIDYDVLEIIQDFKINAHYKNIDVELVGIKEIYSVPHH